MSVIKKPVRGYPVSISDILSNDVTAKPFELIFPVKATMLSMDYGTLIRDESGRLFLAHKAEWFRSGYQGLPQIEEFDELQALNFTVLRKEKVEMKSLSEDGEIKVKEVEILEVKKKRKEK
jgi:hypothetical protein